MLRSMPRLEHSSILVKMVLLIPSVLNRSIVSSSSFSRVPADKNKVFVDMEFGSEKRGKFINAVTVPRTSACRIDKDQLLVAVPGNGLLKLLRRDDDIHRQMHYFAVYLKLLNSSYPVGINGYKGD